MTPPEPGGSAGSKPVLVEEVFKLSGIPTFTFVEPVEYTHLVLSMRTPGRGVVVEGPSGVGKTVAVKASLESLRGSGPGSHCTELSGRRLSDREAIRSLPSMPSAGTFIIDDFHRLDEETRTRIADFIKLLADEERKDTKCVLVGINRTGESLVALGSDVNARVETIKFGLNPPELIEKLIQKGEYALNIKFPWPDKIVQDSFGTFYVAQLLCFEACALGGVTRDSTTLTKLELSYPQVQMRVYHRFDRRFHQLVEVFASGPQLRRGGRAPYLHILKWLAETDDGVLYLDRAMPLHDAERASVSQVVEKGPLETFVKDHPEFGECLHYDPTRHILAAEDPQFIYFLRSVPWNAFAAGLGYIDVTFPRQYDFALSFAGRDRDIAEMIRDGLVSYELNVFYDKDEQHRILSSDVDGYLAPIFRSEAAYVIALMGPDYPKRVWTKIEAGHYQPRIQMGEVIPVWIAPASPAMFDGSWKIGHVRLVRGEGLVQAVDELVDLLVRKIEEAKATPARGKTEPASENPSN